MTEQVALRTEIVYSGVSFSVWKRFTALQKIPGPDYLELAG